MRHILLGCLRVALAAGLDMGSAAQAANPVEWSVDAGGNGHLYEVVAAPTGISWHDAHLQAQAKGGHLATVLSSEENYFIFALADDAAYWGLDGTCAVGPWLGGFQPTGGSSPGEQWSWVTGEEWSFANWGPNQPNDNDSGGQSFLQYYHGNASCGAGRSNSWNDFADASFGYVVEYVPQVGPVMWTTASGEWDTASNWSGGRVPGAEDDVTIAPTASTVVQGPTANVVVKELIIGGNSATTEFSLSGPPFRTLQAEYVRILDSGILSGQGVLAGHWSNDGRIIVRQGERLMVGDGCNSAGAAMNRGVIEVTGGELELAGGWTANDCDGQIYVRNGVLRGYILNDGLDLFNIGTLSISAGVSDIWLNIQNNAEGSIIVTGGGTANFLEDVDNYGTIRVSGGCTAVFLGTFKGDGVTGAGTVYLEGAVQPGHSPGAMAFGGDVFLGPDGELVTELAGTAQGVQYDCLRAAGMLGLDGQLSVSLLDGFVPKAGMTFDILDGDLSGQFATFDLPALSAGLSWNLSQLDSSGVLQVVPEPATMSRWRWAGWHWSAAAERSRARVQLKTSQAVGFGRPPVLHRAQPDVSHTLLCSSHRTGRFFRSFSRLSPSGSSPRRIASMMSGARLVRRNIRPT